jgi:hypothetical protein
MRAFAVQGEGGGATDALPGCRDQSAFSVKTIHNLSVVYP